METRDRAACAHGGLGLPPDKARFPVNEAGVFSGNTEGAAKSQPRTGATEAWVERREPRGKAGGRAPLR